MRHRKEKEKKEKLMCGPCEQYCGYVGTLPHTFLHVQKTERIAYVHRKSEIILKTASLSV